jgi:TRAP-type mannitol/chloroaromatic compound transport system permease small subunit
MMTDRRTLDRLDGIGAFLARVNATIGKAAAWLTLLMVVVTCIVVVFRYAFSMGWIWLQETVTWAHGVVFMLAAAYTLGRDEHVRVDIFYRTGSARHRAVVDLAGTLLLLLPVCVFLLWSSFDYARASWSIGEASRQTGGLPGLFLLKSVIPLTAAMLILQGAALAIRSVTILLGAGEADRDDRDGS